MTQNSLTTRRVVAARFALLLSFCLTAFTAPQAQQPQRAPSTPQVDQRATKQDKINRPVSEPYSGDLSIFEGKDRERKLQIGRVMDILGVTEGTRVADIGAGSGWFTVRAARRVGARGEVYAVEINKEAVDYIDERARREHLPNIKTILGAADDPRLPANSVDAVLILKTYHEIAEPVRLLHNMRAALKPKARIGIIDRNGMGGDHGINRADVLAEVARAGYKLVEDYDFVKPDGMDYFLVFEVAK